MRQKFDMNVYIKAVTVVQWLALQPHSTSVQWFKPASQLCRVWTLCMGCMGFLPQSVGGSPQTCISCQLVILN